MVLLCFHTMGDTISLETQSSSETVSGERGNFEIQRGWRRFVVNE